MTRAPAPDGTTTAGTAIATVLGVDDLGTLRDLLAVLDAAFGEPTRDEHPPPSDAYLRDRLADRSFVAIAGRLDGTIVGGLTAYVLRKPEREASEVYLYDLAVLATHRRRGVARTLIESLRREARVRGASGLYVQADRGDDAAIALYASYGAPADVLHFDIPPAAAP